MFWEREEKKNEKKNGLKSWAVERSLLAFYGELHCKWSSSSSSPSVHFQPTTTVASSRNMSRTRYAGANIAERQRHRQDDSIDAYCAIKLYGHERIASIKTTKKFGIKTDCYLSFSPSLHLCLGSSPNKYLATNHTHRWRSVGRHFEETCHAWLAYKLCDLSMFGSPKKKEIFI